MRGKIVNIIIRIQEPAPSTQNKDRDKWLFKYKWNADNADLLR
jgi:hypothetical protein